MVKKTRGSRSGDGGGMFGFERAWFNVQKMNSWMAVPYAGKVMSSYSVLILGGG
jgi:hypothetical protein